jgi:hypothetical protein
MKPGRVKSIVPEVTRDLTLPSEIIHRGFELAVQIERKQGIEPVESSVITEFHKGHLVRGNISFMDWYQDSKGIYKLKEPEKSDTTPVVFLWATFDQNGLHISYASKNDLPAINPLKENEDSYRLLNDDHDINPFTVPLSSFGLYYRIIQPYQPDRFPPGLVPPIPKEEWKKFHFEWTSQGLPGYKGPATKVANPYLNIEEDCIKIIVVYLSLIRDSGEKREAVHKNPPVEFAFTVIDQNGEDDPAATYDLYQRMFEGKNKKE